MASAGHGTTPLPDLKGTFVRSCCVDAKMNYGATVLVLQLLLSLAAV